VPVHDLRHTLARGWPPRASRCERCRRCAAKDFKTTLIYADYAPSAREAEWVEAAFAAPATLTDRRPAAPTIVD